MCLKKFISTSIFSLSLITTAADASTNKVSQYNAEIERLEQLENELHKLIKEAKNVLSEHSTSKQTESIQEIAAAEPQAETVFAKEESSVAKAESEPQHSFRFQGKETPWVTSFYENNNNLFVPQENIEESCASTPCYQPKRDYCRDSILLYADARLGNRPCFDGSIFTGGLMYFENSFFRNGITLFLDVNGSSFEHGGSGVSAGIGARFCLPCTNTLFGVNTYFDYNDTRTCVDGDRFECIRESSGIEIDKVRRSHSFRQASVGLEWIKCAYSIRGNAYFNAGDDRAHCRCKIYDVYEGPYEVECKSWTQALQGYDIEYRQHICLPCNLWAYPAIGGYYLTGGCCSKLGVMGGLAVSWRNILSVEGIFYYDKYNESKGEAYLSINLPLDFFCNPCCRSYFPDYSKSRVRRRNYIPTEEVCRYTKNY